MSNTTIEKPFKVAFVVRQKHGVLYQSIKKKGWTLSEAAEYLGIEYGRLCGLINLKCKPPTWSMKGKKGEEKKNIFHAKLALLTGQSVEELFPDEVYNDKVMAQAKPLDFFVDRDISTIKLGSGTTTLLLPESVEPKMNYDEVVSIIKRQLTDRQWRVIELRFMQGMTYDEASKVMNVTRECVRQIECRSLRILRKHKHILSTLRGTEDTEENKMHTGKYRDIVESRAYQIDIRDFARPEFLERLGLSRNWPQDKINKAMGKC